MTDIDRVLKDIRRIVGEGRPPIVQPGQSVQAPMLMMDATPIARLQAVRDAALRDRRQRLEAGYLNDIRMGSQ